MDYACDGDVDCPDNSDEIGCEQIEFDESYDKSVPRMKKGKTICTSTLSSGNFFGFQSLALFLLGKLILNMDVAIESIFEISNQRSSMMIEVTLNVSWIDKNLNFKNLNQDWSLNDLSFDEMKSIWMPKLKFTNTRDPDLEVFLASFADEHTTGYIRLGRNAKSKLSPMNELKNYRRYKGTDA